MVADALRQRDGCAEAKQGTLGRGETAAEGVKRLKGLVISIRAGDSVGKPRGWMGSVCAIPPVRATVLGTVMPVTR